MKISLGKCTSNNNKKILHIMGLDKFIPPFIDFMEENFSDFDSHTFFIMGDVNKYPLQVRENTIFFEKKNSYISWLILIKEMNKADIIILHCLFSIRVIQLLFFQPWLLRKCCWAIWGNDLYMYKSERRSIGWYKNEFFRRFVIKRFGIITTFIKGEYDLVKKWYGARGSYQECLLYLSNVMTPELLVEEKSYELNLLIGNSADPSNNHAEILEKLYIYKDQPLRIYCPLSYGNNNYAEEISELGKKLFGEKFIPLLNFMPFKEYKALLKKVDVAIFWHKRQQGLGNIITLMGLGKKIYLRRDVTTWNFFRDLKIEVYDFEKFDLAPIDFDVARKNYEITTKYFSKENLRIQLKTLFELKT